MKKILLTMWVMAIGMVWAMPTTEEIRKAQPLVAELMADDVAAFERGDKTAVEVGNVALEYAGKAETEVAKFVFYKGALQYFVRGKEYDKAAKAVESLRGAVKDIPPEEVVDLIRVAAKGVRGKDAPRLLAVLKEAQQQVQARKGVATAKRVLKVRPADAEARRALAEWFAVGGDWDAALEAFAACGGKEKQTAEAEAEGKDLVAVADFWWAYEPKAAPSDDAFKAHAAKIYRSCIADGTLTGLKKELVEKRLKQAENAVVVEPPKPKELAAGTVKEFDLPDGVKMKFVWCPPGTFMMGSPESEEGRRNDEKLHRVTLTKGFWLGQYEVTQAQWQAVMGNNPSKFKGDDHPVEMVTWDDCQQFIAKCNAAVKGMWFALPTEAQWEYACRAGTTGPFAGTENGWYKYNSSGRTHTVGRKAPNAWNLYDMHGNVWEWCTDWYGEYGGDCTDPSGPASGTDRVDRGGGWLNIARNCRSAFRFGARPSGRSNGLGFRLCCSAGPRE